MSTKTRVETMLRTFASFRDDDQLLMANFWAAECAEKGIERSHFLQQFADGAFTSPESIRRIRQKLQEENPELRGKSYAKRQQLGKEFTL